MLLRFAAQFVGHMRGGLGYANVLSLTFFSGISGSALADAAGPGAMLIRMMGKAGYDRAYAGGADRIDRRSSARSSRRRSS